MADTIPARIRPRPRNSKTGYGEIRGRVIFNGAASSRKRGWGEGQRGRPLQAPRQRRPSTVLKTRRQRDFELFM